MAHRVAPQAEADLDSLWLYLAKDSGNMEVATRLINSITDRFYFLSRFPHVGRSRDRELGRGLRSFPVGDYVVICCVQGDDVFILRVVDGRRDLERLFNQ
jgi:toxin ParE1/3/4